MPENHGRRQLGREAGVSALNEYTGLIDRARRAILKVKINPLRRMTMIISINSNPPPPLIRERLITD